MAGGGLTREIAESLSKKLNPTEMKAIINMDDLLKKNTIKLEYANDDNENLSSKLEGGRIFVCIYVYFMLICICVNIYIHIYMKYAHVYIYIYINI